jgi:hypothetical protein
MLNFYNLIKQLGFNLWLDNLELVLILLIESYLNSFLQEDFPAKLIKYPELLKQIKLILEITRIKLLSRGETIC